MMFNDIFFAIIGIVEVLCVIAFIIGIIMAIFFNREPYKTTAKKLLIYSTIAFIVGFGCCVGGLAFVN